MERMNREPSVIEHEGTIHATVRAMGTDEAELIVDQVVTMAYAVKAAFDAQGRRKPQ